jgi:transposase
MFVRTSKVRSSSGTLHEYVRVVEAYREDGKVKQRTVADLGRKDLLTAVLPQLERLLRGEASPPTPPADEMTVAEALTWGPTLVVRALFEQLGLWPLFEELLGRPKPPRRRGVMTAEEANQRPVPYADRAFVLLANRLIRPHSEHGLASWLETDYVCDREGRRFTPWWNRNRRVRVHSRQLSAWYRTLDQLMRAKDQIEVRLFRRLRDLFHLQPELVLYDITSTFFEGAGPEDLARHGHSRDGKPQNVQVVVGLVLVAGWPIAHHVWAGNRQDSTTVQEVVADLAQRFDFRRVVFVGDRGMVSEENIQALLAGGHGYLVALKRRRNAELDGWLQQLDESRWIDCPMGVTAREKKEPPRTRVQEVPSGDEEGPAARRVFVVDSNERRTYERAKREQAMERTRQRLAKLQQRVADGRLTQPEQIGAAAARALAAHHGTRYFDWRLREGRFEFFEHPVHFPREQRLEGRFVIVTSERDWRPEDAVARYKELTEVERGFRQLKDVLALRPIYHQRPQRVQAHIFVATLALLLRTLLERRLKAAGVDLSAEQALEAVSVVRNVTFHTGEEAKSGVSAPTNRAADVLRALGITELRPPTPPNDPEIT